jgi:hypothetical protein
MRQGSSKQVLQSTRATFCATIDLRCSAYGTVVKQYTISKRNQNDILTLLNKNRQRLNLSNRIFLYFARECLEHPLARAPYCV